MKPPKSQDRDLRKRIEQWLTGKKQGTKTDMARDLGINILDLHDHIVVLMREKKVLYQKGRLIWVGQLEPEPDLDKAEPVDIPKTNKAYPPEVSARIPQGVIYEDWNGNLRHALKMKQLGIPLILVGAKGSGKTQLVRYLAQETETPLFTINLSLRTREHHLIGRPTLISGEQGTMEEFKEGVVIESMVAGGMLYLDELNNAEGDCLIRLDEALDERREINVEGKRYVAQKDWYPISSINPLDHPGTKELPPQILSRFGARLVFPYPSPKQELRIVEAHLGRIPDPHREKVESLLQTISMLREEGVTLPYKPSIRESLSASRMVVYGGYGVEEALNYAVVNTYAQWGDSVVEGVRDLIRSKGTTQEVIL